MRRVERRGSRDQVGMVTRLTALALVAVLQAAGPEFECSRPAAAMDLIGRLRLADIEWAEDVNRAAMWEAFGRCAGSADAEECRERQRRRFGADLDRQRAEIDARYERMLKEFEERCRASIT